MYISSKALQPNCMQGFQCCAFGHQQTGDSPGKSVPNRFISHNVWFQRPIEVDDRKTTENNSYATGEKRWFKGNNETRLWE